MQEVIVSFKNLTFRYYDDHVSPTSPSCLSLDNISFNVNKGDILGIIGPNGAGKSTLFRCMLGLLKDYSGEIAIFDQDIRKDRQILQKISYLQQQKSFDQTFPATVQEIVSLGITGKSNSKQRIDSALRTVELCAQKDRRIGELSGGQQQRVLIAKALVNDSQLLILDEPTTSIDVDTQNKFYSLVKTLNRKNKVTILWSSHDLDSIKKMTNKMICINRRIIFQGNTHEFFSSSESLKMYSESIMQAHLRIHLDQKNKQ
jgi:zinc transport system ATP-binding protein